MVLDILTDNRTCNNLCKTEHGLAILLSTDTFRILLDTGASDLLLHNAAQMGIDLSDVDYVFVSHGHNDHAGGLRHFLQINSKAKVILSPHAIKGRYYSCRHGEHSIKTEWPQDMSERLTTVSESCTIDGNLDIIAQIEQVNPTPKANKKLFVIDKYGNKTPDDFRHELALYTHGLLFTGCAHSGLENILAACKKPIRTVIGGFHLLDGYETTKEHQELAKRLIDKYPDTTFYTSHCTDDKAFMDMKKIMHEHLLPFKCGMKIM